MPVGPNGETLDQVALMRYPDVKADPARPHRRQLLGHRRRRRRRGARLGRVGQEGGPQAARPHPRARDGGRRAGDHADRAGARVAEGAQARAGCRQGHRPVGDQRGVRRRAAADRARARHRSRHASTSTAARSRSATRSARPARSCSAPRSTSSSARTSPRRSITLCIGGGMGIATIIERV